jgi:hypothetical protein
VVTNRLKKIFVSSADLALVKKTMGNVIEMKKAKLEMKVSKSFRNWTSRFHENFDLSTKLGDISSDTLTFLALGKGESSFFIYDLILNFYDLGSGFELNELASKDKMMVMDRYLFLLDRIRFEYMKRLEWLESYPGAGYTIIELLNGFEQLAPGMQARPPTLHESHPSYEQFVLMNQFEKEELIRKLVPKALKKIED